MFTLTRSTLLSFLAVLGLLLASCAPAATPTPQSTQAAGRPAATPEPKSTAPTATPKPAGRQPRSGGILSVAVRDDAPHFDPYLYRGYATQGFTAPTYNGLL